MNLDQKGFYWAYTEYTTDQQKEQNAQYIYQKLITTTWNQGISGTIPMTAWTLNAIAGLLGNMEAESQINPGLYAGRIMSPNRAFGLVQWWPGSKYINWANGIPVADYDIDYQLARLYYEENQPGGSSDHAWYIETRPAKLEGWGPYSLSEAQFWVSTQTPEWLGQAWLFNYERPDRPARYANYRGRLARKWYNFLTDNPDPDPDPPDPGPPVPGQKNLIWWLWKMYNNNNPGRVDIPYV